MDRIIRMSGADAMSRNIVSIALCILAATSVALAGVIRDGSLVAKSNGSDIVVRWTSDSERGVIGYRIERRAGAEGSPFVLLTLPEISPRGDGVFYEFIDNAVFRTMGNAYVYRVTAITSDNSTASYTVTVVHDGVSSVRRTWGSIKAMFR
jgi:hypothetical protein